MNDMKTLAIIVIVLLIFTAVVLTAVVVGLIEDWQEANERLSDMEIRMDNLAEAGKIQDKKLNKLIEKK